jgi:hypothetical protein
MHKLLAKQAAPQQIENTILVLKIASSLAKLKQRNICAESTMLQVYSQAN